MKGLGKTLFGTKSLKFTVRKKGRLEVEGEKVGVRWWRCSGRCESPGKKGSLREQVIIVSVFDIELVAASSREEWLTRQEQRLFVIRFEKLRQDAQAAFFEASKVVRPACPTPKGHSTGPFSRFFQIFCFFRLSWEASTPHNSP